MIMMYPWEIYIHYNLTWITVIRWWMTTLHGCMMRIHQSQGMTLRFLRLLSSRLPNPSNDDEDESDEEIRVSNRYNFRKNPKLKVWFPDASAFFQAW